MNRLGLPLPARPLRFLAAFAALAALLLPAWLRLSADYGQLVLVATNAVADAAGLPTAQSSPGLPGAAWMGVGIVGGLALFAATPDRSPTWKTAWSAGLLLGLLLSHVGLLTWQLHAAQATAGAAPALDTGQPLLPAATILLWFAAGAGGAPAGTPAGHGPDRPLHS